MTKEVGLINVAAFSDVHIGNSAGTTNIILHNLDRLFSNYFLAKLDLLLINGDFFDKGLPLNDINIPVISAWMAAFLKRCANAKVIVRVLEGTRSHDREQSELFITIAEILNTDLNIKYIKTLSIEHITELDLNVLYLPDEWRACNLKTQEEVAALLRAHNLTHVDLTAMHGAFPHQLPSQYNAPVHNPTYYLSITKHFVYVGHIHQSSSYTERDFNSEILSSGSTDRLTHNEEEPKGFWHTIINPDFPAKNRKNFIYNDNAAVFKTFNVPEFLLDETPDSLIDSISSFILLNSGDRRFVAIRLKGAGNERIDECLTILRERHPTIRFSKKIKTTERQFTAEVIKPGLNNFKNREKLNETTLPKRVKSRMVRCSATPQQLAWVDEVLTNVITAKEI